MSTFSSYPSTLISPLYLIALIFFSFLYRPSICRVWYEEVARKRSVEGAKLMLLLLPIKNFEFLKQLFAQLHSDTRPENFPPGDATQNCNAAGAARCITGSLLSDQTSTATEAMEKEEVARKTTEFMIESYPAIFETGSCFTVTAADLPAEAAGTMAGAKKKGKAAAARPSTPEERTASQIEFELRAKATTDAEVLNLLPDTLSEIAAEKSKPKPNFKKIARLERSVAKMNEGGVFFGTEKEDSSYLTPNSKAMQQRVNRQTVVATPMEVKSGMKPRAGGLQRFAVLNGNGGGGDEDGGQENAKPVLKFAMSPSVKAMNVVPNTPSAQEARALISGSAFKGRRETFV